MKQFQFKLDPVLKYRRHQEEKARLDLAEARITCQKIRSRIEDMCCEKKQMHAQLKKDSQKGIVAGQYLACQNFVSRLDRELTFKRADLEKQEEKIQKLRSQLKQQYIKKESLEGLKTNYAGIHKKQVETELQKSSDELVLLRKGGCI
ncbi:MAG: flagellar export protein FliJ [Desulfotignum sp.]|nr:flagellar export protein FliJ [Desulfotignum sp.]MCF8088453.1 flagellar export protein FliJ [Desulfotignum sp.]MCF8136454.1 flagellar export protein FliJ [Desulfotignum sp.]